MAFAPLGLSWSWRLLTDAPHRGASAEPIPWCLMSVSSWRSPKGSEPEGSDPMLSARFPIGNCLMPKSEWEDNRRQHNGDDADN